MDLPLQIEFYQISAAQLLCLLTGHEYKHKHCVQKKRTALEDDSFYKLSSKVLTSANKWDITLDVISSILDIMDL